MNVRSWIALAGLTLPVVVGISIETRSVWIAVAAGWAFAFFVMAVDEILHRLEELARITKAQTNRLR